MRTKGLMLLVVAASVALAGCSHGDGGSDGGGDDSGYAQADEEADGRQQVMPPDAEGAEGLRSGVHEAPGSEGESRD